MGLREDLDRYRQVGEERREDLEDFIQYGDLGESTEDHVSVPIKIIELPEFVYDPHDQGGVGQAEGDGQPDVGEPVDVDVDADDGDDEGDPGEPGEGEGEHGHYEMDPEDFADELDEKLGLDLDPKGKQVVEEKEGEYTDIARQGPNATLDLDEMFKRGLKRKMAVDFDEDYVREALHVEGVTARDVFEWAREQGIPVSFNWIAREAEDVSGVKYESFAEFEATAEQKTIGRIIREEGLEHVPFRPDDERYRYPETIKEKEKNVVVVNIRDVSGSMGPDKRDLVERIFTPMDWYLQGKYDNAEFVYIAHDAEAWEVERDEFFGIQSGGGTVISTAYDLAQHILDEEYPWSEWNRYVFAAGDSENHTHDTEDNVIPRMKEIDANLHAYVETQPNGGSLHAEHASLVDEKLGTWDNVVVQYVNSQDQVLDAIYNILSTEDDA